jgi:hypothetical protein
MKIISIFLLSVISISAAAQTQDGPNSAAKTVSKGDCLANGGKANDGPDGKHLRCQGGKFDGAKIVACAYRLDGQAYIGKDDGTLVFDSHTYRCETVKIGASERDFCKIKNSKSKNFDLVVAFDGAENDFFVFGDLEDGAELCHSIATEKSEPKTAL